VRHGPGGIAPTGWPAPCLSDPAAIPSRERRGRFYVELARGHFAAKDRIAATRLLLLACDEGVDAVRWSPAARVIVDDLVGRPPTAMREDVRRLAAMSEPPIP
jgi:hypothetical protein